METLTPMNIRIPSPYSPTSTELFDWEVFLREAFSLVNKMAIVGKTNIVNALEYDTPDLAIQKVLDTNGVLYVRKGGNFTIPASVSLPSSGVLKVILEDDAILDIQKTFPAFFSLNLEGGSRCTVKINAVQNASAEWRISLQQAGYVELNYDFTIGSLLYIYAENGILSSTATINKNVGGSVWIEGFDLSIVSNKKLIGSISQTSITGFAILRRVRYINTVSRTDWSLHFRYFKWVLFEDCVFDEQANNTQRTIQVDVSQYVYFVRTELLVATFSQPSNVFLYTENVFFFQCYGLNSLIRVFPANNLPSVLSKDANLFIFDCTFETNTATGNYGLFIVGTLSGDKGVRVFCKRTFFTDRQTTTNTSASYGFVVEDPLVVSLDDVVATNIGLFGTSLTKSFPTPSSVSVNNCEVRNNKWVAIYLNAIAHVSVTNCRFYGANLYDDTSHYSNVLYGTCIYYDIPNSHYAGFEWTKDETPAVMRFENNVFRNYPRNAIRLRYHEYTSTRPFFTVMTVINNTFELISYVACVSSGNRTTWESANGTEENRSVAVMCIRNLSGSGSGSQKRPIVVGNTFYRCYMSIFINVPAETQIIANNTILSYSETISYSIQIKMAGDMACGVYITNTTAPNISPNAVKASTLNNLIISGWFGTFSPIDTSLFSSINNVQFRDISGHFFSGTLSSLRGQRVQGSVYSTVLGTPMHDFNILNGVAYGWVPAMYAPDLRLPSGLKPTTTKTVAGINYPAFPVSTTDFVFFNNISAVLGSDTRPIGRSRVEVFLYWENIPSQQNITLDLEKRSLTDGGGAWTSVVSTNFTVNGTGFSVGSSLVGSIQFLEREVYRFKLQSNPSGGSVFILLVQFSSLFRQEMTT